MRLVLDRIESTQITERIFVFEGETENYEISENNVFCEDLSSLKAGLILEAEIVNDKLVVSKILQDETNEKNKEMNTRLANLFNRKK